MTLFRAKTWADRPDFGGHPLDLVPCPSCGRVTHADVIVDMRGVPGTTLRPRGRGARSAEPVDIEWACDACRDALVVDAGWRHSDLIRALGAPPGIVRQHQVRERAEELRRQHKGTYRYRDLVEQAEREIPAAAQEDGT